MSVVGASFHGMQDRGLADEPAGAARPWVYVADFETGQPIGWVYREYIACF